MHDGKAGQLDIHELGCGLEGSDGEPGLARKLLVGDRVDLVTSLARQCFQCAGHDVEDLVDAEFLASKLVGQWDAADTQQAAPGESHEHE